MRKPEQILRDWMQSVNEGDLSSLVALYDPCAVLIPTFSNRLLCKPEQVRGYFEKLCSREDLSVALHEKTLSIMPANDEIFLLQGIYCWRFAVDGEMLSFEARFSYVVNTSLSGPILQHHSSQIPRVI